MVRRLQSSLLDLRHLRIRPSRHPKIYGFYIFPWKYVKKTFSNPNFQNFGTTRWFYIQLQNLQIRAVVFLGVPSEIQRVPYFFSAIRNFTVFLWKFGLFFIWKLLNVTYNQKYAHINIYFSKSLTFLAIFLRVPWPKKFENHCIIVNQKTVGSFQIKEFWLKIFIWKFKLLFHKIFFCIERFPKKFP
jgi:hypothetical protein